MLVTPGLSKVVLGMLEMLEIKHIHLVICGEKNQFKASPSKMADYPAPETLSHHDLGPILDKRFAIKACQWTQHFSICVVSWIPA